MYSPPDQEKEREQWNKINRLSKLCQWGAAYIEVAYLLLTQQTLGSIFGIPKNVSLAVAKID